MKFYTGMKIKFPIFDILIKKAGPIKGMFIQPKMRTSLEITEEYIKLAQFEYIKEMPLLIHLVTRKIPSPNEEDAVKTLRAALSGLKIKGPVLSCLSRHQVTVRYLKLPSANRGELEAMLDFQVAKQIPYPKEETLYSYSAINIDPSGYTDVLLAIVHQEVVCRHLRILKACNIEPELVSFNTLASSAWFLHMNKQPMEAVLFVDVDAIYTDIGIIDSRGLSFTRTVKLGGNDFESERATVALKQLNEEVRLSVSSYEKDSGASIVRRIVLTGAASALDRIKGAFEKEFRLEVEIKLPLDSLKVSKNVLEKNWFDMHKVSLSAVLGLGLKKDTLHGLNLLPPSVKSGRDKVKTKHEIYLSIILIGFIALTVVSFISRKIHEKSRQLNFINLQMQKVSSDAQALEEKRRNIKLIEDLTEAKDTGLYILLELHKIVPQDIELTNFDFENKKGLTLKGTSATMAGVFKFVGVLDKSNYFTNSKVKFVKKRATAEGLTDFEIFCPLKNEGARK